MPQPRRGGLDVLPEPTLRDSRAGRLSDNVVHFARVLRKAGLPVGTDRALLALQALELAGVGGRSEMHDVLEACLTSRVEHRPLFEQAFHVFWRDLHLLDDVMRMRPPSIDPRREPHGPTASQRLIDALFETPPRARGCGEAIERPELQVQPSWSDRERLRTLDFDSMTSAEAAAARRVIGSMTPLLARLLTRRRSPAEKGARLALRAMLRDCGRRGGDVLALPRAVPRTRLEPLCVIVDISGSMSRYSRMFLQFVHALMNGPRSADLRVSAFVFGTRLTRITGLLKRCDPDVALRRLSRTVEDWSGGTRIGHCLMEFNHRWARRLSLAGSTVLLVTDGLELAEVAVLSSQAQRLSRSCRRLLWLNPLLRYDAFAPKARGVRALLPHVDEMLPVHNIDSLERLVPALQRSSRELSSWK